MLKENEPYKLNHMGHHFKNESELLECNAGLKLIPAHTTIVHLHSYFHSQTNHLSIYWFALSILFLYNDMLLILNVT